MANTGHLKSGLLYKQILRLSGFSIAFFSVIFIWNEPAEQILNYYALAYMGLLSAIGLVFFIAIIYNIYKEPIELKVLLIGPPQSGKTVFTSVMLSKLPEYLHERLSFSFDDRNTAAVIARNMESLANQKWLASTNGSAVSFKIRAKLGSTIYHDTMKINIIDVPFKPQVTRSEEDPTPVINYGSVTNTLKGCDALILTIDSQIVVGGRLMSIDELQELYIPLVKELPRDGGEGSKTSVPVAIVFTKTDTVEMLMNPIGMRNLIPTLLQTCKNECNNYRMFYVSSVGHVDEMNLPEPSLKSKNVIDPMTWLVKTWE
jgi:GTPase SAR1 family protein